MADWYALFGQASLVLVSVIFVLSLVLVVLWQLKLLVRWGRQLEQERQAARQNTLPPTDAVLPPPWR
jgi:flagellar biogenesis protein FliO